MLGYVSIEYSSAQQVADVPLFAVSSYLMVQVDLVQFTFFVVVFSHEHLKIQS